METASDVPLRGARGATRRRWSDFLALAPLALAIVQLWIQIRHALRGLDYVVISLFLDDTYYFLQPAWNLHHLGFVTFDGIHATNGVQLLWFGVVCVLAWLAPNKSALVLLTVVCCAVINASAHVVIQRTGAVCGRRGLAAALAILWFATVLSGSLYLHGMDNSIHALVGWIMVWQLACFYHRLAASPRASLVPLTLVLIFNVWARLDSALVSAAVFTCCVAALMLRWRGSDVSVVERFRRIVLPGVMAVVGAAVQLAVFWWMGGSLLPVSAVVKARSSQPEGGIHLFDHFGDLVARSFIPVNLPVPELPGSVEQAVVFVGLLLLLVGWRVAARHGGAGGGRLLALASGATMAVLLVLLLAGSLTPEGYLMLFALTAAVQRWRFGRDACGPVVLRRVWYTVAAAFVMYHAVIIPLGMKPGYYSPWYQAPAHIFWIVGIGWFIDTVARLQPGKLGQLSVGLGTGLVLAFAAAAGATTAWAEYRQSPLFNATYRAARHIAANAPHDAVFGSWNAGLLGYFSHRTLINLDGLMNTVGYARKLRSSGFRPMRYIRDTGISYIVDWNVPADVRSNLQPLEYFYPRPDWKPIVIYGVRPLADTTNTETAAGAQPSQARRQNAN